MEMCMVYAEETEGLLPYKFEIADSEKLKDGLIYV